MNDMVFPVDMMYMWLGLVLLHLVWTYLPQAGYIHPDEFFQSVEIASGFSISQHTMIV